MQFYLGSHMPSWLTRTAVPLFVSHRRLAPRRSLPRALGPWALDSGGFTELALHGRWETTPVEYVAAVRRYADEIGRLDWAAPQDWLCAPQLLDRTGLDVAEHQRRTLASFVELRELAPELPWVPMLQGWEPDDYLAHVDAYGAAGIELAALPLVGLGSIARRGDDPAVVDLIWRLHDDGLRLHGFGVKTEGLRRFGPALASADSMAWSYNARRHPPMPGHGHASCANCLEWALRWRLGVLDVASSWQQLTLDGCTPG